MSRENVEIVRSALDAQSRGDEAGWLRHFDPDVEWIPLLSATEGGYRGDAGLRKWSAATAETFEKFEAHFELRDLGERVLAWGTIHLRGRATGVERHIPSGGILEFRNGKISRWESFGSRAEALKAVDLER
jgi:ketosteroid isomerase-like protein